MLKTGSLACMILTASALVGCQNFVPGFEQVSPDGSLVASYYAVDGIGSPGSASEYVSIRHASGPRPTTENSDLRANRVVGFRTAYDVCLEWTGPSSLLITHSPDVAVEFKLDSISVPEVVLVRYQLSPPMSIAQAEAAGARCGRVDGKPQNNERT